MSITCDGIVLVSDGCCGKLRHDHGAFLQEKWFYVDRTVVVVVIMVVLAAIIITPPHHGMQKARTVYCMNNLKQVGIGLYVWADTHTNQFPFQLSGTNGGSMELIASGGPAAQFQTLSNYLTTNLSKILICPTDTKKRVADPNSLLTDSNVSYFLNIDASPSQTRPVDLILAGDRHLAVGGKPAGAGLLTLTTNTPLGWTSELHGRSEQPFGILLFLDSHVEHTRDDRLAKTVQRQPRAINRLLMP